jgi:hypothetical protein
MIEKDNKKNGPEVAYASEKKITFFNSFAEAEEHGLRQMANHSYEERLRNLETIRRRTYGHLLLPNGNWPPLKKTITIEKGSFI